MEFKIYKFDFKCDCCGEETCMGIVGFSQLIPDICDLCLINGFDSEEQVLKENPASTVKSTQNNADNTSS